MFFRRTCDKGKTSDEPCRVQKCNEVKKTVGEQRLSPRLEVGAQLRPDGQMARAEALCEELAALEEEDASSWL